MIPPPPNITSVISLDLNTYKGSADELAIDYFQMIRNNNQVKDKYKTRIDKVEKRQTNLKDALKGSNLKTGALYRCGNYILGKEIWEYKKYKQRQKYDKHLILLQNAGKIHQKRLQTYHELLANKRKQDRSLYTAHDWKNYLITRKIKYGPVLTRGESSYDKPKMIELDRNIGHKSVMPINELFIDRDGTAHLVYHALHDMEGIGYASAEGGKWDGSVVHGGFVIIWIRRALSVSIYAFYSWIYMWNRLVTPSIDDREVMGGGGEGTISKEDNVGSNWFTTVYGGVAVGL